MIRAGIRRAFQLVGRRRWERDVEDEIKLHLALRVERLIADGHSLDDAFAEAVRRFGPLEESRARMIDAARQRGKHMRRTEYFADLQQDLSFALRTLRRQKGWTAVAVLTLALGVGATTAVFSVVSSLLIHAVPYPNGDRVMLVYQMPSEGNTSGINLTITPSAPVVRAWKASKSFEAIEGFAPEQMKMLTARTPAMVNAVHIEPTFPALAGLAPIRGRMFNQDEIRSGQPVVVLSEGFWRTRLGGKDVLGQRITLDSALYTVVGVLPAGLRKPIVGATPVDLWLPLELGDAPQSRTEGNKGVFAVQVVGRLRPGVSTKAAAEELDSLFSRSAFAGGKIPFRSVVVPPAQRLSFYDSLVMLTFAVGLVLLVACANVAHLLVARSTGRQRELAIRVALGAGSGRVFRQLLTESLLLAAAGTAAGVLVGWVGMKILIKLRPPTLSELAIARLDATTLGLAALVAVTTAIAFGILGSLSARRIATSDALKNTSTNASRGRRVRVRTLLVVSEMALSATLVVGATMLVRSVIKLQDADVGFEPKGLYSLTLSGFGDRYRSDAERGALRRTLMTRLATMPGIRSVALASNSVGERTFGIGTFEIEGEAPPPPDAMTLIDRNSVGSDYFKTMNIRFVQGTGFTDTTSQGRQIIVNAGFAQKHWPGVSAVGRRVRMGSGSDAWLTIVGVVNDALTSGAKAESSAPLLYTPLSDASGSAILLRTEGSANPLTPVQALVRSIDPKLTAKLDGTEEQMSRTIAAPRFIMLLLSAFTVLALVLAAIGLYGVMSYSVAERTREIGIRVALGATRSRVAKMVLVSGVAVALIGSILGVVAASWGTKLIEKQLYGVARTDPVSFSAAIVVLFAAAIVACVVPTRRALAVDPMTAIRSD